MKFSQLVQYNMINVFLVVRLLPNMLLFFKKALDKIKASVSTLAWIFFGSRQFGQAVLMFKLLMVRYPKFWFLKKVSGARFSTTFCVWFFKKNISHTILY